MNFRYRRKNETVKQIDAGYAHTILLTDKGEVWAFGCSLFGQMGNGDNKKVTKPIRVDGMPNPVRLISAGYFHNIVVDELDCVYGWGCNPQVLRLEAQQKKRERLQIVRKELEVQQLQLQQQQLQQQQQQQQQQAKEESKQSDPASSSLFKDIRKQARQALGGSGDGKNSDASAHDVKLNGSSGMEQSSTNDKKESNETESSTNKTEQQSKSPPPEENEMLHLVPGILFAKDAFDGSRVVDVSCGNQHSMFLTDRGTVYAYGRNTDGQLGINSRKEAKVRPTLVFPLRDDVICHIACGGDYSLALADTGTVFAWGNNSGGQQGKAPLDETQGEGSGKVVVLKTTRRVIRLQNNLQNTCDVPKPVPGIGSGVYSDDIGDEEHADDTASALRENIRLYRQFRSTVDFEVLLHLALEAFHAHLDAKRLVKQCLVSDNPQAAAKISLLSGNVVQAFEFTLQLNIRQNMAAASKSKGVRGGSGNIFGERIFNSFFFYLMESRSVPGDNASLARRQLLERLIACWQDQKFSFVLLEKLFLKSSDPLLLQTLVLTLFCPEEERRKGKSKRNQAGPMGGGHGYSGPRLVDLFTPEFCLKIGDTFVKGFKEPPEVDAAPSSEGRRASVVAGEWLSRLKKSEDQV
jgi:hypothetical protein